MEGKHLRRKSKPIPEELKKAKAYEIWETREHQGKDGSSETDWHEAIEWLSRGGWLVFRWKFWRSFKNFCKIIILPLWLVWNLPFLFADPNNHNFALDVVKTVISALGLIATVIAGIGLLLNYLNSLEDRRITQERLITDRFSKAVEQLGSEEESVRLGGIYSLERIAKDSPRDDWAVMEVLTSYVRKQTLDRNKLLNKLNDKFKLLGQQISKKELEKLENELKKLAEEEFKKPDKISVDTQAVLTVIGRRDIKQIKQELKIHQILNLQFCELMRADLVGANLIGVIFLKANLSNANLSKADLRGTLLSEAILSDAKLLESNLEEATLVRADLTGAYFKKANLTVADLTGANLKVANLTEANLKKADLTGADLTGGNFTGADLREANLRGAYLREANLTGVNLEGADFRKLEDADFSKLKSIGLWKSELLKSRYFGIFVGLTPQQVKSACFWDKAKFDKEFQKQLESSPPVAGVDCSKWQK